MNNRLLNNIKKSPYYANHGKHAKQKKALPVKKSSKFAQQRANRLKKTHEKIRQKNTRKKKGIRRRDKKKNKPQLKKKNKIYLLTNNLRTKRPSKKFDYRKVDLFFIKAVKKLRDIKQPVKNYKFNLSRDVRIYLIFDIRFLESAHPDILL